MVNQPKTDITAGVPSRDTAWLLSYSINSNNLALAIIKAQSSTCKMIPGYATAVHYTGPAVRCPRWRDHIDADQSTTTTQRKRVHPRSRGVG